MPTLTDAELAIAAACAGAAEVRERYSGPLIRRREEGGGFATWADLASEVAIRKVLRAEHRPPTRWSARRAAVRARRALPREWLVDRCAAPATSPTQRRRWSRSTWGWCRRELPSGGQCRPFTGEVSGPTAPVPRCARWRGRPSRPALLLSWSTSASMIPGPMRRSGSWATRRSNEPSARGSAPPRLRCPGWRPGAGRPFLHRGRPARQRPFRRAHRHRQGGGCVVSGIHGQPLHTQGVGACSPLPRHPPTPGSWRCSTSRPEVHGRLLRRSRLPRPPVSPVRNAVLRGQQPAVADRHGRLLRRSRLPRPPVSPVRNAVLHGQQPAVADRAPSLAPRGRRAGARPLRRAAGDPRARWPPERTTRPRGDTTGSVWYCADLVRDRWPVYPWAEAAGGMSPGRGDLRVGAQPSTRHRPGPWPVHGLPAAGRANDPRPAATRRRAPCRARNRGPPKG